ncbi:MAG: hypothetical protein OXL96_28190 [Candidatus Poribacteria bacterium]|nr:hypothetical protein [Candidatus Poribacteria bacterium]
MVKAVISNNDTIHRGNFSVNVAISHPIANLEVSDFTFEAVDGNGITGIEFPESLEVGYSGKSKQTLLAIPIELPDNASGSFRVRMRDKQYAVDNTQYEVTDDQDVLPATEEQRISCESKVFEYATRG